MCLNTYNEYQRFIFWTCGSNILNYIRCDWIQSVLFDVFTLDLGPGVSKGLCASKDHKFSFWRHFLKSFIWLFVPYSNLTVFSGDIDEKTTKSEDHMLLWLWIRVGLPMRGPILTYIHTYKLHIKVYRHLCVVNGLLFIIFKLLRY